MNIKIMNANVKDLFKSEIIKKLTVGRRYFRREELRALLSSRGLSIQPKTLNRYLVEFNKEGCLYSAGRGWYSSIASSFELDERPVKKISDILKKKYPLLSFSVWSTEQIKSHAHHMLTKFVVFVYTERDAMFGIYDFLKDSGYAVWLNPRGNEARKFTVEAKTIVIRPVVSREPVSGNLSGIEKILVDLFVEASALNLMDEEECFRILRNTLGAGRVDAGALLNYARRRKLKTGEFVKKIESI